MPLYIRDHDVADLVVKLQVISKAPSKTAAVRAALEHEIARYTEAVPLSERLATVDALAAKLGFQKGQTVDFDMKAFSDEMWGE